MRLVVIAAAIGDLCPARVAAAVQKLADAMEALNARDDLRRQSDLVMESGDQVLAAAADLAGQGADVDVAAGRLDAAPRPGDAGRRRAARRDAVRDQPVEQREAA